jgi:predicted aspartyl protease
VVLAFANACRENKVKAMEMLTMGKVTVSVRIENLADLIRSQAGDISSDDVRAIDMDDVLVDTGATMLSLPSKHIRTLGLQRHRTRKARTTAGLTSFGVYEPVRLTVQERDCVVEVCEIPDDCPPLIGQIPLEALDFVVDPNGQKLLGNPEHGGKHMIDLS